MNEPSASMNPKAERAESAEEVFARIQRRRGMLNATDADMLPPSGAGDDTMSTPPADSDNETLRAGHGSTPGTRSESALIPTRRSQRRRHDDEHRDILPSTASDHASLSRRPADGDATRREESHALVPLRLSESVWGDEDDAIDLDPGFPRSKTFRTLVRHPELALAIALPTAYLALRSRAIRRTAYQVGKFAAKQQLWKQVRRFTG